MHTNHESGVLSARRASEFNVHDDIRHDLSRDAHVHAVSKDHEPPIAIMQSEPATQSSTPRQTSIYDSNIELSTINPNHHDGANGALAETEFSLPPVDTGKDAWLFLFSAFVLEVLVWGMHLSTSADLQR